MQLVPRPRLQQQQQQQQQYPRKLNLQRCHRHGHCCRCLMMTMVMRTVAVSQLSPVHLQPQRCELTGRQPQRHHQAALFNQPSLSLNCQRWRPCSVTTLWLCAMLRAGASTFRWMPLCAG